MATPAIKAPRGLMGIPRTPFQHVAGAKTPNARGGGANPIAGAAEKSQGITGDDFIPEPVMGGGPISGAIAQARAHSVTEENRKQQAEQTAAKRAQMSDALNTYDAAVQAAGGDRNKGLVNWMQSEAGHNALLNNVAGGVASAHSIATQAQAQGASPAEPQVTELPHGLIGVNSQDGKGWKVLTPKQYEQAASQAKPFSSTDKQGNPLVEPDPDNPGKYRPIQVAGTSADNLPPGSPGGPPVHEGKGMIPVQPMNVISSTPDLVNGLQIMSAIAGKAGAGPLTGLIAHIGGIYAGVNDPAQLWKAARNQVEFNAARFFSGTGGGATGYKQFIANLPTYNESSTFNRVDANMFARTATNTAKNLVPLIEQKIGGALPAQNRQALEKLGIYSNQESWRDPYQMLAQGHGDKLTDSQLAAAWEQRDLHDPKDWQSIIAENDRRLKVAQANQQNTPNSTVGGNVPNAQVPPQTGAPSLRPGTSPMPAFDSSTPPGPMQGDNSSIDALKAPLGSPPGGPGNPPTLGTQNPPPASGTPGAQDEIDKSKQLLQDTDPNNPANQMPHIGGKAGPGPQGAAEPAGNAEQQLAATMEQGKQGDALGAHAGPSGMQPEDLQQHISDAAQLIEQTGPLLAELARMKDKNASPLGEA